jgi:DNA-binding winged helix-turn-helix (wHTH) protein
MTDRLETVAVGAWVLKPETRELICPRGCVKLTPIQYRLLEHLMKRPFQVFPATELLRDVWGYAGCIGEEELVRQTIHGIRGRIETDPHRPSFLRNVQGQGYMVGQRAEGPSCADCGLLYTHFGADVSLSDEQWEMITGDHAHLLCGTCIARRVQRLPGAIVLRAKIQFEGAWWGD